MKRNKKLDKILLALLISGSLLGAKASVHSYGMERQIIRINGEDRYDTSVKMSKRNFEKSEVAVLVSGEEYADAVVGKVMASNIKAPLLMVKKDEVPKVVNEELDRLGIKKIIIVGGENTISEGLRKSIAKKFDVKRVSGKNRHETSLDIAKLSFPEIKEKGAIYVNGYKFPDAVVGLSLSNLLKMPLILTDGSNLTQSDYDVANPKSSKNIVIGGEKSMNIEGLNGNKIAGSNRYKTSLAVAKVFFKGSKSMAIANGEKFQDSLIATEFEGNESMPLILSDESEENNTSVVNYMKDEGIGKAYIVGGEKSISSEFENKLKNIESKNSDSSGTRRKSSSSSSKSIKDKINDVNNELNKDKENESGTTPSTAPETTPSTEPETTPNRTPESANGEYIGAGQSYQYTNKGNNTVSVRIEDGKIVDVKILDYVDDQGAEGAEDAATHGFNDGWRKAAEKIIDVIKGNKNIAEILGYMDDLDDYARTINREKNPEKRVQKAEELLGVTLNESEKSDIKARDNEIGYRNKLARIYAKKNNIEVDAISGATNSKRSLLEATQNAMEKYENKKKNIAVSEFVNIAKNKNPKINYKVGETLNLNDLAVNLVKPDKTFKVVEYRDFDENKIVAKIGRGNEELDINQPLKEHDRLIIKHTGTNTSVIYNLVVLKEQKNIYLTKIKYKFEGDSNYREQMIPNGNESFIVNIDTNENSVGKKIAEIKFEDNEGREVTSITYPEDKNSSEKRKIDSLDYEFSIDVVKTSEMESQSEIFKFPHVELHFKSKDDSGIDFSKVEWIKEEADSTLVKEHYKGFPVNYSGLKIGLYRGENEKLYEIGVEDFSKYGIEITPENNQPISETLEKKIGFSPKIKLKGKEFTLYNQEETNPMEIKVKEKKEEKEYKDPVVYKVTKIKEEPASNFKKSYKVGETLNLSGLKIDLLDEHGDHPANDPQSYPSGTPDYIVNHENRYLLVPDVDGNEESSNTFSKNNITLNMENGKVLSKGDTKLIITYTNKEHDDATATLEIPIEVTNVDSTEDNSNSESTEPGNTDNEIQPAEDEIIKSIGFYKNPDIVNYHEGDKLSFEGMELTLNDEDGPHVFGDTYLFTKNNMKAFKITSNIEEDTVLEGVGDKDIVFTYHGVKSEPLKIHVFSKGTPLAEIKKENQAKEIFALSNLKKTTYTEGETIDLDGLYLRLKDESGEDLGLGSDYDTIFTKDNFAKYGFKFNLDSNHSLTTSDNTLIVTFSGYGKNGEEIGKQKDITLNIPITVNPK